MKRSLEDEELHIADMILKHEIEHLAKNGLGMMPYKTKREGVWVFDAKDTGQCLGLSLFSYAEYRTHGVHIIRLTSNYRPWHVRWDLKDRFETQRHLELSFSPTEMTEVLPWAIEHLYKIVDQCPDFLDEKRFNEYYLGKPLAAYHWTKKGSEEYRRATEMSRELEQRLKARKTNPMILVQNTSKR